jgi:hypothetical protein
MKRYFTATLAGLMWFGTAYAQTSAGAEASASQNAAVSPTAGAQASSSTSANAAQTSNLSESTVQAELTKSVDASKNKAGDEVVAKTRQDVKSNGQVVIPRGSKIMGHVTEAKARAKGQEESSLGLAFDHAVLKNGTTVPVSFSVQAIGSSSLAAPAQEDSLASSAGSTGMAAPSAARSSGGLVGGVGATAGGVSNTAAGATGSLSSAARVGGVASAPLSATSHGVVGMPNVRLVSATTSSTASTITSNKSNVHLDSGTEMILRANQ